MALSVSPAQIPQSTGLKTKRNQAEIALEQQIEIQQTSDAVTGMETSGMTPLMQKFAKYDAQFRNKEKAVQSYGELGLKVEMVTVPPIQQGRRWEFEWYGVKANQIVQQVQQQIAAANVLRGLAKDPSVQQAGKRLNMVPIIQSVVESAFSARLAPKIFEDIRDAVAMDPELENQMLVLGLPVHTSTMDDDPKHIQLHMQVMQGAPPGTPAQVEAAKHIAAHQQQMQMKQQAMAMAQMQAQGGGRPSRGGGPPRQPQAGAQPAMPRAGGPPLPGRIHPDQMARAGTVIPMPRKM
jgi:hypothetical protein